MVYSPALFRALKGVFCIYKPPDVALRGVIANLQQLLAEELNSYKCRPVKQRVVFLEDPEGGSPPRVTTLPDLADDPRVIGPRYLEEDFRIRFTDGLGRAATGVVVMHVNEDRAVDDLLSAARYMKTYHLSGVLGSATLDGSKNSRILRKASYSHATHDKLDRILAKMQSGHQRNMFHAAGVQMDSQKAYELAVQGFSRPLAKDAGQVVYGMKCIEFDPPHFTLEVHCIGESSESLVTLVHNLGVQLQSLAYCSNVRRIRYGHFLLDYALTKKQWTAQNIIDNIQQCKRLVSIDKLVHSPGIQQLEADALKDIHGDSESIPLLSS